MSIARASLSVPRELEGAGEFVRDEPVAPAARHLVLAPPFAAVAHPMLEDARHHEPDERSLKRAGVTSLAAVIPVHSHYDHALDSPIVAQATGAVLVGSSSSANIAKGEGLPDARIRLVNLGDTVTFGCIIGGRGLVNRPKRRASVPFVLQIFHQPALSDCEIDR